MASMVTTAPSRLRPTASFSSRRGMALVSLVLSSTASCPRTSRLLVAKAETRWSAGRPLARSWLRRTLAVDGDHVERIGPAGANPVHEAGGEQVRIDPVHHDVDPAPRGNAPVERQKPPQELEMVASPISDGVEAVALGDRGADAQQQNLVQLVSHVFRTAFVLDPGKVLQQKSQPRRSRGFVRRGVHQTGSESGAPMDSAFPQLVNPR